jgi:hypothetical protein
MNLINLCPVAVNYNHFVLNARKPTLLILPIDNARKMKGVAFACVLSRRLLPRDHDFFTQYYTNEDIVQNIGALVTDTVAF